MYLFLFIVFTYELYWSQVFELSSFSEIYAYQLFLVSVVFIGKISAAL
jgi:hypothetical protein